MLKGFSFPNGLQYSYPGKQYLILISTYVPLAKKYRQTTYTTNVLMPSGTQPIVTVGYRISLFIF